MAFRTGTIAFARFRLEGNPPTSVTDEILETLRENQLRPNTIGAPPEVEYGWIGGRHVFDDRFEPDDVVFGDRLLIGMRIDTNKVPAELRRAYRAIAEQELATDSSTGMPSRSEKRAAREAAEDRCRDELAAGRFRSSKMVPVLWDLPTRTVLAPAVTDASVNALGQLFDMCFEARLEPSSAGAIASSWAGARGASSSYEDVRPSMLTEPPALATSEPGRDRRVPVIPWSQLGPQPKDFLGNEFLLWLWWMVDTGTGMIETEHGVVAITLDRMLELQCAWDVTGRVQVTADRATTLRESREAIRLGKWPRKVGFVLADDDAPIEGALQADRWVISAVRVQKSDDARTPRDVLDHRVEQTIAVDRALQALYTRFLLERMDQRWTGVRERLSGWVAQRETASKVGVAVSV